jgi:hypothetical protein
VRKAGKGAVFPTYHRCEFSFYYLGCWSQIIFYSMQSFQRHRVCQNLSEKWVISFGGTQEQYILKYWFYSHSYRKEKESISSQVS